MYKKHFTVDTKDKMSNKKKMILTLKICLCFYLYYNMMFKICLKSVGSNIICIGCIGYICTYKYVVYSF